MQVKSAEISKLRYEEFPSKYVANVSLEISKIGEDETRLIHLKCRTTHSDNNDRIGLANMIMRDAKRQLAWIPAQANDPNPIEIPQGFQVSWAE